MPNPKKMKKVNLEMWIALIALIVTIISSIFSTLYSKRSYEVAFAALSDQRSKDDIQKKDDSSRKIEEKKDKIQNDFRDSIRFYKQMEIIQKQADAIVNNNQYIKESQSPYFFIKLRHIIEFGEGRDSMKTEIQTGNNGLRTISDIKISLKICGLENYPFFDTKKTYHVYEYNKIDPQDNKISILYWGKTLNKTYNITYDSPIIFKVEYSYFDKALNKRILPKPYFEILYKKLISTTNAAAGTIPSQSQIRKANCF